MKIVLLMVCLLGYGAAVSADVVTVSTEGQQVAFTNDQSNLVWSPSAVIVLRGTSEPVELSIFRHGQGQQVLLAQISATASNLIWLPRARYGFGTGSSLVVVSSVADFTVQLHRGPIHD